MSIIEMREQLHDYIETADEQHLSAILTLVGNGAPEKQEYVFDEETMNMLYKRVADHENGLSKSYTVEESFALARHSKKK